MNKQIWNRPPSYHGARSNKRLLKSFGVMLQGLAATSDDCTISLRLKDLQRRLEFRMGDNIGHADVQFFAHLVYEDLLEVRAAMNEDDKAELDLEVGRLEKDVKKLTDLIREEVAVTPWDDKTDRRVAKLIENTASIRNIFKRATEDLRRMQQKRDKLVELLMTEQDRAECERLRSKEMRLSAYCDAREKAVKSLDDILDELDELASLSHNTPSLAGRANRCIKIKRLADFYVHPMQAQAQREKLKNELLFIIKSVNQAADLTDEWASVMYGDAQETTVSLTSAVRKEKKHAFGTEGTQAETSSRWTPTAQPDLTKESSSSANKYTARKGE